MRDPIAPPRPEATSEQAPDRVARHLLAEYWDCTAALDDPKALEESMRRAARAMGLPVVDVTLREGGARGVSAGLLVAGSHLSIHTWPQSRYVAADLYTASDADPLVAHELLAASLRAGRHALAVLERGTGHPPRITSERASSTVDQTTTFVERTRGGAYHHHHARVLARTKTRFCADRRHGPRIDRRSGVPRSPACRPHVQMSCLSQVEMSSSARERVVEGVVRHEHGIGDDEPTRGRAVGSAAARAGAAPDAAPGRCLAGVERAADPATVSRPA